MYFLSVAFTQDSSEAPYHRQSGGHHGGFPVDGGVRQGGRVSAGLLHHHHDQNYLHQL